MDPPIRGKGPQPDGSSFTVLVYMAADNALEPFALQDLVEMEQAGGSDAFRWNWIPRGE